jgi:transmembrane sensor
MKTYIDFYLIEKILSGTESALEKKSFEEWILESEQNKAYYEEFKHLWEKFDGVYNKVEFDKKAAKVRIQLKIAERRKNSQKVKTRYWVATAASILLLIGLGFFINNYSNSANTPIVYSTGNSVREIILADSSHIWLNSNSSLLVPRVFSKKQRKVNLRGEAYFEITRDEKRPFKILTGKTITEVLGTTFNINMDTLSGDVNVIVNSGRVAFYRSNQSSGKSILNKNVKGQYLGSNNQIMIFSNTNQNFLSWKTGVLTFSDTPLEEVCKELTKLYKKNVKADSTISGVSLTGSFRNEKLEDILKTIQLTLNVEINGRENEIVIHN